MSLGQPRVPRPKWRWSLAFALAVRTWCGNRSDAVAARELGLPVSSVIRCRAGYRPYRTRPGRWPEALRLDAFRWARTPISFPKSRHTSH